MNKIRKNISYSKPLVSVVIPVYNGAEFLKDSVDSALKSTYKNIEIILIDDGSTDKSRQLCHTLVKKDKRIVFYNFDKNKGLCRALNFALKKARGEYICRINQDDTMDKSRIEIQVKFLLNHPEVSLLGSWLLVENEKGNLRINQFLQNDEDIKRTWLKLSPCWDASVMYRKAQALKVGGYDQKFWPADDLHMWYRLGSIGQIANIAQPLVKIKFHAAAASLTHHKEHILATYRVHQWANKNIEKALPLTQIFWFFELIAGLIFPARFNWFVYRFIKKYLVYPIAYLSKKTTKTKKYLLQFKYAFSQS